MVLVKVLYKLSPFLSGPLVLSSLHLVLLLLLLFFFSFFNLTVLIFHLEYLDFASCFLFPLAQTCIPYLGNKNWALNLSPRFQFYFQFPFSTASRASLLKQILLHNCPIGNRPCDPHCLGQWSERWSWYEQHLLESSKKCSSSGLIPNLLHKKLQG